MDDRCAGSSAVFGGAASIFAGVAWRDLMRQYRLLFEIGRLNRDRGHRGLPLAAFWRQYKREKALTAAYPPTH